MSSIYQGTRAAPKPSPDDPTTVGVFDLCIDGQEIAPGYTKQNNPIEQATVFEQASLRAVLK